MLDVKQLQSTSRTNLFSSGFTTRKLGTICFASYPTAPETGLSLRGIPMKGIMAALQDEQKVTEFYFQPWPMEDAKLRKYPRGYFLYTIWRPKLKSKNVEGEMLLFRPVIEY